MGSMVAVSTVVVGTLVALAVLASRYTTVKRAIRSLESRGAAAERELAAARRQAAQVEADQQFLARVVHELPHVARELHASAGGREIPGLLLGAVVRLLEPKKVAVAVRRRAAENDPDRHQRLAVVATSPEDWMPIGSEIPIGTGEIGYAAEVQRVMDRRDFESQPSPTRNRLRGETAHGCHPDIVAPMIFIDEVVGVIVVEGVMRPEEVKDALRLLAQVGAVSMYTRAQYTEIKTTASVDGLTGAFNKRYLTHRLGEEMRRALDQASSVSVLIFDVDNFKHYNDRNGHLAGDRVLQRLARLVVENVRRGTIFGRYGGEEFLAIFPGAAREQALAAAENVRRAVAAHEFPFGFDQPLGAVTISGGVAECPVDGADAATLVRAADEALYQAKRRGRNRMFAYEPTNLGGDEARVTLAAEAHEDPRGRLAVEGQPTLVARAEPTTVVASEAPPPKGTLAAADYTPVPGTLFALASVTPAMGVPKLTLPRPAANPASGEKG